MRALPAAPPRLAISAPEPPAPYAVHPGESRGRLFDEPDSSTRTAYQRDRDRVIHSGAFRKLQYKTQVFIYHEGDYFRTRLTHTVEVAQIARTLARQLRLNEDLAEAVALAHDLGHTPFGHAGEDALAACMADHGGFSHNDQSLRILTRLERRYAAFDGLNLTWETLEGVAKHNGPMIDADRPRAELPATVAAVDAELSLALDTFASAEAQVAALADDIAYNNHDVDDGLRAGLFTLADLADLPLVGPSLADLRRDYPGLEAPRLSHELIRRVIDRMVTDLLDETRRRLAEAGAKTADDVRLAGRALVAFSDDMQGCHTALRGFLRHRMYRHYKVNRMSSKARRALRDLFALFLTEPDCLPSDWQAEVARATDSAGRARVVADYIAGMTDRFAFAEHARLFDMDSKT